MYFTDRGIEELEARRGDEAVDVAWLAERLRDFVNLNPEFDTAVDRLATWLARLDDLEEDLLPLLIQNGLLSRGRDAPVEPRGDGTRARRSMRPACQWQARRSMRPACQWQARRSMRPACQWRH
jgi:Family of unknown function (DUF6104)